MTNKNKAYLLAGLVVLCWSTVASAFKLALRYLQVPELLLYSTFFSALAVFFILAVQGKLSLLKNFTVKDYLYSALLGFLNPFLYYLVIFKAYNLLPAQIAQPLNMTWGIVLVLISIPILKQRVKSSHIIAFLICLFGVVVISTEGNLSTLQLKSPGGVALALGSSFIWAFYWVLNVKDKKDALARLFLNFLWGFIFIGLGALFVFPVKAPAIEGLMAALYIGLFEMGLAFAMWIRALKLTDKAADIAILIYIVPFISFVFLNIFVGEEIRLASVIGAIFIVGGIILNQRKS
ncbi:MAG: DMT family transporter [bacterium]|nr:DMT family transporter [bacterium]